MRITNIRISNFKSFDEEDVKLGRLNVLIGANASGKSNFVNIFRLLSDALNHGLENAISIQGGTDYLRNLNLSTSRPFSVEMHADFAGEDSLFPFERPFAGNFHKIVYRFMIRFYKTRRDYEIKKEFVEATCDIVELEKQKEERWKIQKKIGKARFTLDRKNGKLTRKFEATPKELRKLIPKFMIDDLLPTVSTKKLVLETAFLLPPCFILERFIKNMFVYDVYPRLSKGAGLITGKTELESDGSNLALVLKNILMHEEDRRKIFNLVKDVLPFVEGITVEKFADKFLIPFLKESYCKEKLPASLISDGTMNLTAIILALYFEKRSFIIIEEPERNIHPYLISKVMNMMNDVSMRMNKQIIVTTHNPEVVKHAGLENILLIRRDDQCNSRITRPSESKEVAVFLENEMGVDELYVKNLLK